MESSTNQIIINTKDSSNVIRNIIYTPNRNISIINSNSTSGSNTTISDLVNLDMNGSVASITNSSYQYANINNYYGLINYTIATAIPLNEVSIKFTLNNSVMQQNSNLLIRCISCSSGLNPLYIHINQNRWYTATDLWVKINQGSLAVGTVLKFFFIVN